MPIKCNKVKQKFTLERIHSWYKIPIFCLKMWQKCQLFYASIFHPILSQRNWKWKWQQNHAWDQTCSTRVRTWTRFRTYEVHFCWTWTWTRTRTWRLCQQVLYQVLCTYVPEARGYKNIILTSREWTHLSELCEILEPLLQATNIGQGDRSVTISCVLPAVFASRSRLQQWQSHAKYCKAVVEALLASLLHRFSGLIIRPTPPQLCHTTTRQ